MGLTTCSSCGKGWLDHGWSCAPRITESRKEWKIGPLKFSLDRAEGRLWWYHDCRGNYKNVPADWSDKDVFLVSAEIAVGMFSDWLGDVSKFRDEMKL
jgi:hypothetical protein